MCVEYNYSYVLTVVLLLWQRMESEFVKWMDWYGKSYGEFELTKGDFLSPEFAPVLSSAT